MHSRPGQPEGRGKIERFFRTVRDQFLVEIGSGRELADLVQLNTLFTAWVETVYHRRVHSETGQAPLERWSRRRRCRCRTPAQLREAFLWSESRTVTKTATVGLHGNTYEVDAALAGRKVELVYDPFDLTSIEVRWHGRPMGTRGPAQDRPAHPPKARPDESTAPPPATTGIDYLRLVEAQHTAELAERVQYSQLPRRPVPDEHVPGQLPLPDTNSDVAGGDRRDREAASRTTGSPRPRSDGPRPADAAPPRHPRRSRRPHRLVHQRTRPRRRSPARSAPARPSPSAPPSPTLDTIRHTVIYLGNPAVGGRGLYGSIVTALGGVPRFHKAALIPQTMDLLAAEEHERGRTVVLVVDEAHLLDADQLEELRLLTNADMDSHSPFACLLVGQPTLRRRIKLGTFAALDQRITLRYAMHGMTDTGDRQLHRPPPQTGRRAPTPCSPTTPLALIHQVSRGLPRAVNNLAVQALVAAFAAKKDIVDESSAPSRRRRGHGRVITTATI